MPELPQSRRDVGRRKRRRPRSVTSVSGRSGLTSAPSWRSTRALDRASSEVSAPPMWLVPGVRAPSKQRAMGEALVAGDAHGPADDHEAESRRVVEPAAERGRPGEVRVERRVVARGDEPSQLRERRARAIHAPPAPPRGSGGRSRAIAPDCSRPAGWCRGRRCRTTRRRARGRRAPWPARTPPPAAGDWSRQADGRAARDRSARDTPPSSAPRTP